MKKWFIIDIIFKPEDNVVINGEMLLVSSVDGFAYSEIDGLAS